MGVTGGPSPRGAAHVVACLAVALWLAGCGVQDDVHEESGATTTPSAGTSVEQVAPSSASGPPTTRSTPTPTTTKSAATPDRAATTVTVKSGHLLSFATPDGGVTCQAMGGGGDVVDFVRCAVPSRSWDPPKKPADCDLDYEEVVLSVDGAEFVCAGDTVQDASARRLVAGDTVRVGTIRCTTSAARVTCAESRTGHSFALSAKAYQLD